MRHRIPWLVLLFVLVTLNVPTLSAQVTATALLLAYAIIGFAVLHTLTLALKSRTFWLGSTYAVVVVFGWPVIAMVILGLADAVFGFRERFLRTRQPPPLPTP